MAATVIDLLAGGADRGKEIVSGTPRRSCREYAALWRQILDGTDRI